MTTDHHYTYEESGILYDDIRVDYDGEHAGDVVNVYENATLIVTGPVLSGVKQRSTHRP